MILKGFRLKDPVKDSETESLTSEFDFEDDDERSDDDTVMGGCKGRSCYTHIDKL